MLVLGIDPGTAITGYGLVRCEGKALEAVAYGVIRTSGESLPHRLQQLHRELLSLIAKYQPTESSV